MGQGGVVQAIAQKYCRVVQGNAGRVMQDSVWQDSEKRKEIRSRAYNDDSLRLATEDDRVHQLVTCAHSP